ncbi:MAG: hypothetical protein ACQESK_01420 [Bacteroidota bacterium]
MKFNNKHTYILAVLLIFFTVQVTIAQSSQSDIEDLVGFDNTVDDTAEAPIHFLIPFFMLIGAYLGIKKLKK